MKPALFALGLVLPLCASAQSVQLSTSQFTTTSLLPNRAGVTTIISNVVVTITPQSTPTSGSGSQSATSHSGSSTAAGSGTSSVSTTTSAAPITLSTAPTDLYGGGDGPGGAPSPGATAPGGIYGPGDGYVSAAFVVHVSAAVVGLAGLAMGGAMVLS